MLRPLVYKPAQVFIEVIGQQLADSSGYPAVTLSYPCETQNILFDKTLRRSDSNTSTHNVCNKRTPEVRRLQRWRYSS